MKRSRCGKLLCDSQTRKRAAIQLKPGQVNSSCLVPFVRFYSKTAHLALGCAYQYQKPPLCPAESVLKSFLLTTMASLTWVLLLLLSVSRLARSEENFKNNWIEPDGNKNDFEQTFYVGDTLNIQWAGWDSWYIETFMENSTQANLYVVAWNADVSSFFRILKCTQSLPTNY